MLDALRRLIKAWEEDGNGVGVDACERAFLRALSGNVPRGPAHPARILIAAMELAEKSDAMEEGLIKTETYGDEKFVREYMVALKAYRAAQEPKDG